jgi:ABC-type Fe3+-hydroxamate transport system substrate-binding protein
MSYVTGAALALLLAGCGPSSPPPAAPERAASTGQSAAAMLAGGFPREVQAPDGTQLRLAAPPQRVVAGASGVGDILCELLPPERLAGLPDQMRDYSSHRAPDDPWLARPSFHVFAAEPVLALRPDLVVADHWQPAETSARLREAGLPVLVIDDLERLEDVRAAVGLLGRALGEETRAEQLLAAMDERIARLAAGAGARRGLRALAYTNGGTGGWAAAQGTSADEWIGLAGLTNALASREGHVRFSFEELLTLDPDVLVVCGADNPDERGGTEALVRDEPLLAGLRARRRGLIVTLPSWLFSTNSHNIVTAAEELAQRLDALLGAAPP